MQGSARIDELRQKFHENPRRYFAPLANEYRKAGDPEQAIAICRAHLAQQPGHMSGHVVYGQALFDAQRIDESRTVFEKALSLDPDNAIVLRQLGDIARQRGETAEAKHWYGRALDADPHDSEVAAYIAELTEPLTESAETAAPVASETPAETPAEETATPVDAGITADADSIEDTEAETAEVASDTPADVDVSEEPTPAAASMELAPEEPTGQRDARTDTPVGTPMFPLADVAWRKTPPHEDSPFVTRTMAELYAKQGYRAAALDVYRKLALTNPDDRDVLARIEELTREPGSVSEPPPADESPGASEQQAVEAGQGVDRSEESAPEQEAAEPAAAEASDPAAAEASEPAAAEAAEPAGAEVAEPAAAEAAEPVETDAGEPAEADERGVAETVSDTADGELVRALDMGGLERGMEDPVDWSDVSDNADAVYTPSAEELDVEPEPPSPPDGRHFTELEISAGDTWDTDTWGAGFSADESTDLELDVPDTPILDLGIPAVETVQSASAAPSDEAVAQPEPVDETEPVAETEIVAERETFAETEAVAETDAVAETEAVAEAEAVAEPTETVTATEPEVAPAEEETAAVEETNADAIDSAAPAAEAESEPESIPESPAIEHEEDDAPHLVAYSPQPPDDEDLAHYEPKGPTVREFFATLGARKPPTHESNQSFTARAAVPAHENPSEYPLAASAFADLFPDSPVAEEDTRAAFALSGAMSSTPSGAPGSSPPETVRSTPSAPAPPVENAQESDEDIRRFRAWLDGLAES